MYYIYHIPGKKIGVTRNLKTRVTLIQGYKEGEYEVLEQSTDIDYISDREIELQKSYKYSQDFNSFKTLTNQFNQGKKMAINVTEQTVTFPVAKTELKQYLAKNTGFKIAVGSTNVELTEAVQKWILKNSRTSHFRQTRSYVYNKSLLNFIDEEKRETLFTKKSEKPVATKQYKPNVYDLIREWADAKGIYKSGDSKTQYMKLMEESGELAEALLKNDETEVVDAIGDMVVVLTNLAKLRGHKIEDCVTSAYNVIKNRKGNMINGTFVKSL
jgi:NTP pyrophosphatase (non-canonical NTP hydrolase)